MPKDDIIFDRQEPFRKPPEPKHDKHHSERQRLEKEYEEAGIPAWKARTKISRYLDEHKDEFEKGK